MITTKVLEGEATRGEDGLILVRIGDADESHVALSIGPHSIVLRIAIDETWAYKIAIPMTDFLEALTAETQRTGH